MIGIEESQFAYLELEVLLTIQRYDRDVVVGYVVAVVVVVVVVCVFVAAVVVVVVFVTVVVAWWLSLCVFFSGNVVLQIGHHKI